MILGINYGAASADLLTSGKIYFDSFKCPAWPELIAQAQAQHAAYVHFPLKIGAGIGDALDTETGQPANWRKVETLLAQTGTPFVNLHFYPTRAEHPDLLDGDPAQRTALLERALYDARAVVRRFGAEHVMIENDFDDGTSYIPAAAAPELFSRLVRESGCGFLLDLSHARITAAQRGLDARDYIGALPVERLREVHISGVQYFGDEWGERMRRAGVDAGTIRWLSGRLADHLPMTEEDWELCEWALEQIHAGRWAQPWAVTLENGGVGPLWEVANDAAALRAQVPRLHQLVHNAR